MICNEACSAALPSGHRHESATVLEYIMRLYWHPDRILVKSRMKPRFKFLAEEEFVSVLMQMVQEVGRGEWMQISEDADARRDSD